MAGTGGPDDVPPKMIPPPATGGGAAPPVDGRSRGVAGGGMICFIANPFAASGRLGRQLPWLREEAKKRFPDHLVVTTQKRGDLPDLAADAVGKGFATIVAVGGDGTINEVVDGIYRAGAERSAFGVVPMGTGSDFIKSIRVPGDPAGALDLLATTPPAPMDLGVARFRAFSGERVTRAFINIADFGLGGEVVERANRSPKWLGRLFTFFINTVVTLARFKSKRVQIRFDQENFERDITAVVIANGQYFGGGMRSAPRARVDDGLFDVLILDAMPAMTIVKNLGKLYGATEVLAHPSIHFHRTSRLEADSEDTVLIDLDGEQPGKLPASFELIPRGIRVIRPPAPHRTGAG